MWISSKIIFALLVGSLGMASATAEQYSGECLTHLILVRNGVNPDADHFNGPDGVELFAEELRRQYAQRFQTLSGFKRFREFLRQIPPPDRLEAVTAHEREAVQQFLNWQLKDYEGAKLELLRNRALHKALRAHGISGKGSAWDVLGALSQRNKARVMPTRYQFKPEMEEGEALVSGLSFTYIHNTNDLRLRPDMPIFSSHQLERLSLGTGLNTNGFNRDVLHNDDHVFFSVLIGPVNWNGKGTDFWTFRYGKERSTLNQDYAEKAGWISLYVMHPYELLYFARSMDRPLFEQVWSQISPSPPKPGAIGKLSCTEYESQGLQSVLPLWQQVARRLGQWDFTVPDFEEAVRNQLLLSLDELRLHEPEKFQTVLADFRNARPMVEWWIKVYVFEPWGLNSNSDGNHDTLFELKVPVVVPPRVYTRSQKNRL